MARKKKNFSKLGLGIALVVLGAILISGRYKIATNLGTSFADEPVEVSGFTIAEVDEGKLPERIVIPGISIDLPVEKAQIKGGYWEVFPDSAGWGEGSGIPGEVGNQIIFAHAREGLFLPLKKIERGSKIYIFSKLSWFAYEVIEIKEVSPNQIEVIEPTEDERLTLYTCSGFTDSKRLIVIGKRV
jgi:sortase A